MNAITPVPIKDEPVLIRRIGSGYLVIPDIMFRDPVWFKDQFAFESFEALVKWLDKHFTKPEEKENP